jgi:cell division protein FtsI/penicillin-binding protein 2
LGTGVLGLALSGAAYVVEAMPGPTSATVNSSDDVEAADGKSGETPDDNGAQEGSLSLNQGFREAGYPDPREEHFNESQAFKTPFGQLKWQDIADRWYEKNGAAWVQVGSHTLKLTINPELQASMKAILQRQRNIAGAIVLMESHTGRLLALAERRGEAGNPLNSPDGAPIVTSARAPAASLMKITTATAAIEKVGLRPHDEIPFFGGCGRLRGQNWLRDARRDRQKLTFARAFGVSCNTAFARLALYQTGLSALKRFAEGYMYNKPIPSDLRLETSAALLPQLETATAFEVGEAGAGFGASKLNPVHAAMIAAAAGNEGTLMAPYLVDAAYDSSGKQVYAGAPRKLERLFSAQTAASLQVLMRDTVLSGTSRKYFRRKGTRNDRFEIGGKTGTLSDPEDRTTLYTWFNGLAPLESSENMAIGALVASPKTWVVRASEIAQQGLSDYLRLVRTERIITTAE